MHSFILYIVYALIVDGTIAKDTFNCWHYMFVGQDFPLSSICLPNRHVVSSWFLLEDQPVGNSCIHIYIHVVRGNILYAI